MNFCLPHPRSLCWWWEVRQTVIILLLFFTIQLFVSHFLTIQKLHSSLQSFHFPFPVNPHKSTIPVQTSFKSTRVRRNGCLIVVHWLGNKKNSNNSLTAFMQQVCNLPAVSKQQAGGKSKVLDLNPLLLQPHQT